MPLLLPRFGITAAAVGLILDAESPDAWQRTPTARNVLVSIVGAAPLRLVGRRYGRPIGTHGVSW